MATLGEQARVVVTDHFAPVLQRLQEDIDRIMLFHNMAGYSMVANLVTVREDKVCVEVKVPMGTLHITCKALDLIGQYDWFVQRVTERLVENPHMFKGGYVRII